MWRVMFAVMYVEQKDRARLARSFCFVYVCEVLSMFRLLAPRAMQMS